MFKESKKWAERECKCGDGEASAVLGVGAVSSYVVKGLMSTRIKNKTKHVYRRKLTLRPRLVNRWINRQSSRFINSQAEAPGTVGESFVLDEHTRYQIG